MVDFTDTIQEARQYEWNFGDGSPVVATTEPSIQHVFNQVGTYNVMMIAIDPEKCIQRDTSYVTIRAGNNEARLDFNPVKLSPPCEVFRYRFDNTSAAPAGIPFKAGTFTWDFGDNSGLVTAGPEPVFHTYAAAGTYLVKLVINDTAYCNSPDTVTKTLRVAANVKAAFKTPPTGCAPYEAVFENESQGGAEFRWEFGDGSTSSDPNPTHLYQQPGTYTVRLTATDPNTCNVVDNTTFTLTVVGNPTADFTAAPQPPTINTPITFTNLSSSDAVEFKWLFGDGDSLITTSRSPVRHEYNLTGTYNTCLIAYNAAGCPAQVCQQVSTIVEAAVDVPTGFTPLSNDVNSVVFVRGYGIAKMRFAVFARWGEKVFETADKKIGWDGRYKGKLLPMDAYAYTLDVEFTDGKKFRKTGDITLIR
jgi:gliding motility-associated-like protein